MFDLVRQFRTFDTRLLDRSALTVSVAVPQANPDNNCVEVCHSLVQRQLIRPDGFLAGEQLLPGFHFPIADLFREWDWD